MLTARNFSATQPFGASTNVGSLYCLMSMVRDVDPVVRLRWRLRRAAAGEHADIGGRFNVNRAGFVALRCIAVS